MEDRDVESVLFLWCAVIKPYFASRAGIAITNRKYFGRRKNKIMKKRYVARQLDDERAGFVRNRRLEKFRSRTEELYRKWAALAAAAFERSRGTTLRSERSGGVETAPKPEPPSFSPLSRVDSSSPRQLGGGRGTLLKRPVPPTMTWVVRWDRRAPRPRRAASYDVPRT